MTENEKLRALLAEAREVVKGVLRAADSTPYAQWDRDQHQAEIVRECIDAALAEPVADALEWQTAITKALSESQERLAAEVKEALRERDEARAEVERLRAEAKEYSQDEVNAMTADMIALRKKYEKNAYQRGAEAMREAVLYRLNPDPLKPPMVRGFSLWDEIKHTPIPEDKP